MRLLLKVVMIVFAIMVSMSTAEGGELTLKEAIAIAMSSNPNLKAYAWSLESQKADVNAVRGRLYPKIKIEEKYIRTDNPTYGFMAKLNQERFEQSDFLINRLNDPDDISDFQTSLSFEQPLFLPGVYHGLNISKRELKAMEIEFRRKKEEVTLDVIKTFLMIQTAREQLKAAQKGVGDAQEHKRLALLKYETGTGLYSDVLRAEVGLKRADAMAIKAGGDLEVSMMAFGLVLGRTGPADAAEHKPEFPLSGLNAYIEASAQRSDIRALSLRYENSVEAVKMEKSVFLPEAGIGGSYMMNDHKDIFSPEGESYLLAGFLRWDLFDVSSYYKIRKSKAKAHEAQERVSGLEKEIHFRISEAYTRVKEKKQNLALSRSMLDEAEESLRLVRTRYENSLAPLIDLLDVQVMVDNARAGLIEAENNYVSGIADLYYQSGILLEAINSTE